MSSVCIMSRLKYQMHTEVQEGLCTSCGKYTMDIVPGTENAECSHCGEHSVYSLEVLLAAGKVEFTWN